jgi:hypothetical protein
MIKKRSKSHYLELGYVVPPVTAKKAAAIAIRRIESARVLDVGYLVYLLQHSNILVLAGLRAVSPSLKLSPEMSGRRLQRFEQYLKSTNIYLLPENKDDSNDSAVSYSLCSPKAIERLHDTYTLHTRDRRFLPTHFSPTVDGFTLWSYELERNLAMLMEGGTLPRTWLYDWWAPHSVRNGMLLGYPGAAISSYVWAESDRKHNGKTKVPTVINMYEPDDMLGEEVNFLITKPALQVPEVAELYELWNSVIKEVVDTFAAYNLDRNKMFLSEFRSYRRSLGR